MSRSSPARGWVSQCDACYHPEVLWDVVFQRRGAAMGWEVALCDPCRLLLRNVVFVVLHRLSHSEIVSALSKALSDKGLDYEDLMRSVLEIQAGQKALEPMKTPAQKRAEAQRLLRQAAVLEGKEPVWETVSRYNGALEEYKAKYGLNNPRKRFTLYRFRDDEDTLLYVGMTRSFINRMRTHQGEKDWWEDVSYITVEHFDDIESLREAELLAISSESPLYNKADLPMCTKSLVSDYEA